MIHARITDIRTQRRVSRFPLMTGGLRQEIVQDFGIDDIELRVQLTDYDGRGVSSYDAIKLIEQAIEQALNGPPPAKSIPLDVALPPGPRKITL